VHNFGFVQMVTHGLGAKRDNAGAKKSPQQIQMLEKFYSGNYKLMLGSPVSLLYISLLLIYLFIQMYSIQSQRKWESMQAVLV
jgi:hypothetical protein